MAWLARERGQRFTTYQELWRWSVTDLDDFWSSIWDFSSMFGRVDGTTRLLARDTMARAPGSPAPS